MTTERKNMEPLEKVRALERQLAEALERREAARAGITDAQFVTACIVDKEFGRLCDEINQIYCDLLAARRDANL